MESAKPELTWPAADFSRVPHQVYVDGEVYQREQERVFRGPVWNYLGLEAEIPEPGDFVLTSVGDASVILDRDTDGHPRAFLNRCSHRGALICQKLRGNTRAHTCVYHQWTFDLRGDLQGVPYRRGIRGQGGMPADFDLKRHSLRKLRVESCRGLVFGTFSDEVEPLGAYIGESIQALIDRTFRAPLKVLGYARQRVPAKLEALRGEHEGSLPRGSAPPVPRDLRDLSLDAEGRRDAELSSRRR